MSICFVVVFAAGCGDRQPTVTQEADRAALSQGEKAEPPQDKPDASPEETIVRALNTPIPKGPRLAATAYDRLFSGATETRLRELAQSANPSIALQARWELQNVAHAIPSDTAHPNYIPGFLEGEFGLNPPIPWAVDFAIFSYHNDADFQRLLDFYGRVGFTGIKKRSFLIGGKETLLNTVNVNPDVHRTSYGPGAPKNIEIMKEGKRVVIIVSGKKVLISPDLLLERKVYRFYGVQREERADPKDLQVAAAVRGDRAFVAVYEDSYEPLSLLCVECDSGQLVWRSVAWAAYVESSVAMSGPSYAEAQLVCDDGKVTVFGRGRCSGYYVESFDARTGENILRFSSQYWNSGPKSPATLKPVPGTWAG
ncbi:MAG: hypothetical protein ACYC35_01230 [Pirellulales bacterium]